MFKGSARGVLIFDIICLISKIQHSNRDITEDDLIKKVKHLGGKDRNISSDEIKKILSMSLRDIVIYETLSGI